MFFLFKKKGVFLEIKMAKLANDMIWVVNTIKIHKEKKEMKGSTSILWNLSHITAFQPYLNAPDKSLPRLSPESRMIGLPYISYPNFGIIE